jgi:hypothetical protein
MIQKELKKKQQFQVDGWLRSESSESGWLAWEW